MESPCNAGAPILLICWRLLQPNPSHRPKEVFPLRGLRFGHETPVRMSPMMDPSDPSDGSIQYPWDRGWAERLL